MCCHPRRCSGTQQTRRKTVANTVPQFNPCKSAKYRTLRGSNTWAWFPVLEAVVDLQELKDSPSNELPGFNDRLMAWLPTMIEHRCSIGERGGFFERLRRGTYQGHILEHVTLELQQLTGCNVGFGKARETSQEGVYKVVIEFEEATLGHECLRTACGLNEAAVYGHPFDITAELKRLRDLADDVLLGPSTRAIVDAAEARGIPDSSARLPAAWCSSAGVLASGAFSRRKPIAPARLPNRLPTIRN